jgi:hypothetical protein
MAVIVPAHDGYQNLLLVQRAHDPRYRLEAGTRETERTRGRRLIPHSSEMQDRPIFKRPGRSPPAASPSADQTSQPSKSINNHKCLADRLRQQRNLQQKQIRREKLDKSDTKMIRINVIQRGLAQSFTSIKWTAR